MTQQRPQKDHILFDIAMALHRHRELDPLLDTIAHAVQSAVGVEGASVILLDEERQEFFFRVTAFDDRAAGDRMKEIRYPAEKGIAGHVYRTGRPLVVQDTYASPYFFKDVDEKVAFRTRSMLDVPIQATDRTIGVLCAVNKKNGTFVHEDIDLMSAIAGMVAMPIENARIAEALRCSLQDIQQMNASRDRAIHRISHEIKTPVSVLAGSLALLRRQLGSQMTPEVARILERSDRNLKRLLEVQYAIEDILLNTHGNQE